MSTNKCHFLHCSAVHSRYCRQCIVPWSLLSRVDVSHFFAMKRLANSPLAPSSTGKDTSLLPMASPDLNPASSPKDEQVEHYLPLWALSCPLARRQFNNVVQYVHTATSTQTTVEACKAAAEAYTASLPPPPPPPCVNLCSTRGPPSPRGGPSRSSERSVSWTTTAPSPVPATPVQFAPSMLPKPLEGVGGPHGIGSPRCHGVAQGRRDLMAFCLMRQVYPVSRGLVRSIHCSFPLRFIVWGMPTPWQGAIGPNSPSPWPTSTALPAHLRAFGC